eukprot:TRINITY_DN1234_c0_g1_i5.p1 TRINITY_DN1234_c0_g1~~TRINITY_DN1234_c0_g1_i5.p1  ORF type:complete len:105 (-),score=22.89 TRINITY_DN1234_c0_g1_i5:109-423(-)
MGPCCVRKLSKFGESASLPKLTKKTETKKAPGKPSKKARTKRRERMANSNNKQSETNAAIADVVKISDITADDKLRKRTRGVRGGANRRKLEVRGLPADDECKK